MSTTNTKKYTKNLTDLNLNSNLMDGVAIMDCIVSGSSGERTIPKELVEVRGIQGKLKGTKVSWFPQEYLKFVNAAASSTRATLAKFGVKYGQMTLVPIDRVEECQLELDDAKAKFEEKLAFTMDQFDIAIADHKTSNPEVADLIEEFRLSKDIFEGKFKFKALKPIAMTPMFAEDEEEMQQDVAETLYDEIAAIANKVYVKSIYDVDKRALRDKVSGKVKSSLRMIYNKMASLAFVDSGIVKVLEDFKEMLDGLPPVGYIEGNNKAVLNSFMLLLSDSEKLKLHGRGESQLLELNEEDEEDEIVDSVLPTFSNQPVQQTTQSNEAPVIQPANSSFDFADAW